MENTQKPVNKLQLLQKTGIDNVMAGDLLVAIYYLCRAKELGLIDNGPVVTTSGFDVALNLIESGWILSEGDLNRIALADKSNILGDPMILGIVLHIQDKGYEHVKTVVEKLKNSL